MIEQLVTAEATVLWVLKSRQKTQYPLSKILKSLIHQALAVDKSSHNDKKSTFQLCKFVDAHSEDDYLTFLGNILKNFQKVYIVIEVGAMDPIAASHCEEHLQRLSQRLSDAGATTIVKVLILACGPYTRLLKSKDGEFLSFDNTPCRRGKEQPYGLIQSAVRSPRPQISRQNVGTALPFHASRFSLRATEV